MYLMRYLTFHIVAFIVFISFLISILWTKGIIREVMLFRAGRIRIRLRNLIDAFMFFPRLIIPLPFIDQIRFPTNPYTYLIGIILTFIGFYFMIAGVSKIYGKLLYDKPIELVTDGVYGIVRHPIYFGDSIWPVGLSIIFGAFCSLLLTPIWIIAYLYTIEKEEEFLIKIYRDEYLKYRKKVKKFIPFIY